MMLVKLFHLDDMPQDVKTHFLQIHWEKCIDSPYNTNLAFWYPIYHGSMPEAEDSTNETSLVVNPLTGRMYEHDLVCDWLLQNGATFDDVKVLIDA